MNPGEQNYWQTSQEGDSQATPQPAAPSQPAAPQAGFSPAPPAQAPVPAAPPAATPPPPPPSIDWEASEFIHHPKGVNWFAGYGVFAVVLLGLSIFIMKDILTSIGFVVMLVAVLVVSMRPPRTLRYALDSSGIHVGSKIYDYRHFQSFSILQEDGIWSVLLMPTARFQPPLSIYFAKEQGEKIVDILGAYLPMENHKLALVDRLSSRFRL